MEKVTIPIPVMIVEHHGTVAESLERALESEVEVQVVARAGSLPVKRAAAETFTADSSAASWSPRLMSDAGAGLA